MRAEGLENGGQDKFVGKFVLVRYAELASKIVVINIGQNDEESGMMVGKYLKRCPICGGAVKRASAPYLMGRVVIEPQLEVDKCARCGEEFYTAEQVARAQEKATKLGIWRPWLEEERELKRIGESLVVSIPKAMAKSLDLAPKQKVKMKLTEQGISVVKKLSSGVFGNAPRNKFGSFFNYFQASFTLVGCRSASVLGPSNRWLGIWMWGTSFCSEAPPS